MFRRERKEFEKLSVAELRKAMEELEQFPEALALSGPDPVNRVLAVYQQVLYQVLLHLEKLEAQSTRSTS